MRFMSCPVLQRANYRIRLHDHSVRSPGRVASSGIAATFIDGGKTDHSTLKISLDIHNIETPDLRIIRDTRVECFVRTEFYSVILVLIWCAVLRPAFI